MDKLAKALSHTVSWHDGQVRKGTDIPYVCHPLAVCSLVIEDGGTQDEQVAALFHDLLEDTDCTPAWLREHGYSENIISIIKGCSDTVLQPKPPWRARKEAHITHLGVASESVLRVVCADKIHNAQTTINELRELGHGHATWNKFNAPRKDQEWYYKSIAGIMMERLPGRLPERLDLTTDQLFRMGV